MAMIEEPLPRQVSNKLVGIEEEISGETLRKTVSRLAVRHSDHITVWNTLTKEKFVYPLPERLRGESDLRVLSLGNGQLLISINRGYWERGSRQELVWLDETGKELRLEKLELLGYVAPSLRDKAWQLAEIAPVPAACGFAELVAGPFSLVNEHKEPTYLSALRHQWQQTWPACVAVLVISALAAACTWRWHKQYFRSQPLTWVAFVFLLGVPGLLAYWLNFRQLPMGACSHCGMEVPRNREACAKCAEVFPEPKLLGTEIFA